MNIKEFFFFSPLNHGLGIRIRVAKNSISVLNLTVFLPCKISPKLKKKEEEGSHAQKAKKTKEKKKV